MKISTIIPVLNGEKWIAGAIESFLAQEYTNAELIIVDNGCTDKTKEIAKKYNDKRISYHVIPDTGIFHACNYGLSVASGDIFHTMACDHRLTNGAYKKVVDNIGCSKWLFGNNLVLNENEVEILENKRQRFSLLEYRKENIISGCAAFTRIDFIKEKGLVFNQEYPFNGDYDFYLRLAHLAQPKQIDESLIAVILRDDGLCDFGNNEERRESDKAIIRSVIEQEHPLPSGLEQRKPRVLVAVCNQGWVRNEVSIATMRMSHDPRYDIKFIYPQHKPYENALSHVALQVKKELWDFLVIIDDDNPPQKNPLDLIQLKLDIVACPTPQWNDTDKFPIYFVAMDNGVGGWNEHKEQIGLQEVDAVGSGCVVLSRKVLEAFDDPFKRVWSADGTMDTGVDFNFCQRAKEKGFKVYAHYDYLCSHFKELDLLKVLEFKLQ